MFTDGLPLAIELAAARIKLLPPQALLARLYQRLDVLTGHLQDVPARQQTLRNTIAWSYNLLDTQEQRLFRRLSVFVDGCSLQEVERLCVAFDGGEAAGQTVDRVALLIDKSLVQQIEQEGQELRLVMLETIREYANVTTTPVYSTPDLPSFAPCAYSEVLRLAILQPGGRSPAHKHSGLEVILVLDGTLTLHSLGQPPQTMTAGQGAYVLPNTPLQVLNTGSSTGHYLAFLAWPVGQPFQTNVNQAP